MTTVLVMERKSCPLGKSHYRPVAKLTKALTESESKVASRTSSAWTTQVNPGILFQCYLNYDRREADLANGTPLA